MRSIQPKRDPMDGWVTWRNSFGLTAFFPASLDTSGFLDVSTLHDAMLVLIDPETGQLHDSAEYFKQHEQQIS